MRAKGRWPKRRSGKGSWPILKKWSFTTCWGTAWPLSVSGQRQSRALGRLLREHRSRWKPTASSECFTRRWVGTRRAVNYRKVITLNLNFAEMYCNLGILRGQLCRYEQAVGSCAKAVEINPTLAVAHCSRGAALQALGRLGDAARSYREVLAL